MGSKRFLFAFGIGGGLGAGLVLCLVLWLGLERALSFGEVLAVLLATVVTYTLGGYLTWFQWAARRARARARILGKLAGGDLTATTRRDFEGQEEVRGLILSLRRALFQVQRVTGNLHRTCSEVGEQARSLLEAARRQGSAVDRTLVAVSGMGESLHSAGKRVAQVDAFAQDTTHVLTEMTERIEQVAGALGTLDAFALETSERVQWMAEGLGVIAASGDALLHFAEEAEQFVSAVEGGIDSVRRRARETGDLAREVTATSERGEALVSETVRGMYRIDETVRKAAEVIDGLGTRSTEIGRIVDVIQEVADQTNLLALNAAIIAAQAGTHGRAFGVVADEIRSLAERTARSTREISQMVTGVRSSVQTAVALVKESRAQASSGVHQGDRAAASLKEIRTITQRTFASVEATVAETARLESQGREVVEASQRVARQVAEVTRAAGEQASSGRALVEQTQEMKRLAQSASEKAEAQARTGRDLSDSVLRLTSAIDDIRTAHQVLNKGDSAISEEVAQVREDARKVIRIGDTLSRTVDQLGGEAKGLESAVFRFKMPQPRRGGTLRVGIHQPEMFESSRGLDPLFTIDNQIVEIAANLYVGLLESEDGVLSPSLAERWEADPSARRYRFHLRRDVMFHDGTQLKALDVKRHFERLLDPALRTPDQWILKEVEGVDAYLEGRHGEVTGLEVLDDHTLEIRLVEPKAFFLHLVTLTSMCVAKTDAAGRLVGSGPYRPVRIDAGGVVLERHPTHFRQDQPLLDRLEFSIFRGRDEAIEALEDGRVELVSGLHEEHVAKPGLAKFQIIEGSTPSCYFIGFNVREAPYSDPRVRQAIRAGLDITGMVERFHTGANVARTLTPPELLEPEVQTPPPRPDIALAERLLRESGHRRLRMTLTYAAGRSTQEEDAILFRPLLDAGLIELTHEELGATEFLQRHREGRVPAFRGGWIADYPDPDNFLYFLLNSTAQTLFSIGYSSPELDRLTSEARVSIDPELRLQLYRRAERIVQQDCPFIPLFHERIYAGASVQVQGLRLHPSPPQVRFDNLWLDQG